MDAQKISNAEAATEKMLLIIDPQIDFITGSLPVPGAENAMNALAGYLRDNSRNYSRIIVTADRHPMNHCSFRSAGGQWPRHCVADSVGAAIWPALMDVLVGVYDKVTVLHKGEDAGREEYSIFKNAGAKERILRIIGTYDIGQIDVCGLAGDICVSDTITDGIELVGGSKFHVLDQFSPSIDGGVRLKALVSSLSNQSNETI